MAATVAAYGHALAGLGRFEEAEQAMLASVPHLVGTDVRPDRRAARVLAWTADLYEAWHRPEDALRYRDRLAAAGAGTG